MKTQLVKYGTQRILELKSKIITFFKLRLNIFKEKPLIGNNCFFEDNTLDKMDSLYSQNFHFPLPSQTLSLFIGIEAFVFLVLKSDFFHFLAEKGGIGYKDIEQ